MLIVLLCGLVGIVVSIINERGREKWHSPIHLMGGAFGALYGVLVALIVSVVVSQTFKSYGDISHLIKTEHCSANIVSLENRSNIRGNFILGSGSIGEEEYYYMYQKLDENTYTKIHVPVRNCLLIETDKSPEITWDRIRVNKWFLLPLAEGDFNNKIHVPKGTIIKRFGVN